LPAGARAQDIRAVRAIAHVRPPQKGRPAVRPTSPVLLKRINTIFMLDEQYQPGPRLLEWHGAARLDADGAPFELAIR
jgi:hypothetical protein